MSVQFEDQYPVEQYGSRKIIGEKVMPGISQSLINSGLAKNMSQANILLFAIIIVSVLASIAILSYFVFDINPFKKPAQAIPPQISLPPELRQ